MPETFVAIDLSAPAGQRLSPAMREEIAEVAPSAVVNGSITEAKLADLGVTNPKIADGAVGSTKIATSGVATVNIAASAVTTAKLNDGAVTPEKVGVGVVTAKDASNNDLTLRIVKLTVAQYAALGSKDPNTLYGTI